LISSSTVSSGVFAQNSFAQELYTPRNIKKPIQTAVVQKTGKPGGKYWQNHGKYTMEISVDQLNMVSGTESIIYDNSKDTLKQ
jgi:hypothetical protein